MEEFRGSAHNPFEGVENVEDLPFGTPDEEIAACIDGHEHADAKAAALRAHRTQIPDSWWMLSIADNFGSEFMGVEFFTLAVGDTGRRDGLYNCESDLFAGLE
jgi:N-acetyl-1-D-myo-inositol-2-amino-2-deoxy-alpha-D-glucopyranoside deacetylase